jgi:hypothetical protein
VRGRQRSTKAGFRSVLVRKLPAQEQLALQPVDLGFVVPLAAFLHGRSRLAQCCQPLRRLPERAVHLHQESQEVRPLELGAGRPGAYET